jgi:hypothetical protein
MNLKKYICTFLKRHLWLLLQPLNLPVPDIDVHVLGSIREKLKSQRQPNLLHTVSDHICEFLSKYCNSSLFSQHRLNIIVHFIVIINSPVNSVHLGGSHQVMEVKYQAS